MNWSFWPSLYHALIPERIMFQVVEFSDWLHLDHVSTSGANEGHTSVGRAWLPKVDWGEGWRGREKSGSID